MALGSKLQQAHRDVKKAEARARASQAGHTELQGKLDVAEARAERTFANQARLAQNVHAATATIKSKAAVGNSSSRASSRASSRR